MAILSAHVTSPCILVSDSRNEHQRYRKFAELIHSKWIPNISYSTFVNVERRHRYYPYYISISILGILNFPDYVYNNQWKSNVVARGLFGKMIDRCSDALTLLRLMKKICIREIYNAGSSLDIILLEIKQNLWYSSYTITEMEASYVRFSLQWRHNGRDGVSDHQPYDCLLNRLFRSRSKKNIKARRQWPLWGKLPGPRWISRTKGQ